MVIRVSSPGYLWLFGAAALAAVGCDSDSASLGSGVNPQPVPQIKVLSNRADMVSGGDALVEIVLAEGVKSDGLHVTLGGKDVTSSFAARANVNGRIIGLVTGMAEGTNILAADLGGGHGSYLEINNHKIGGPVFSGPQVKPFICATPTGSAESGDTPRTNPSGLSTTATDAQCNIATEARLFYKVDTTKTACNPATAPDPVPFPATPPADACFKLYTAGATDVAMTTTDTGAKVPYIVRVERGTINRGIYDIAVLFDPAKDDVKTGWKPFAPQAGWNGKVVYSFGASSGQPKLQFHSEQSWIDDAALSRGFLVAINSMTDSLYNDNRVSMTETVMMMKEKIIDSFGEVRYMIGNGCSGGSINQLTAASIYPGLLDGIQPTCTYPDSETTGIEVSDCALLVAFYNSPAWKDLMAQETQTQVQINLKKAAINGHEDQTGCHAWFDTFVRVGRPNVYTDQQVTRANDLTGVVVPVGNPQNNCGLPASMVYNATSKTDGVRCSVVDHAPSIWGTVTEKIPGTDTMVTHARATTDNVGVQYGLKAFLSGAINADEFVLLNEQIGGVDFDDNPTATRTQGDPKALETAYRAGIVSDGAHLAKVPIMDLRGYDDARKVIPAVTTPPLPAIATLGIHHEWRSFALRARLDAANGNHANHVMWRYAPALVALGSRDAQSRSLTSQSFLMLDQWLSSMKSDTKSADLVARIVANKPSAATDLCNLPTNDPTVTIRVTDMALCSNVPMLTPHTSPRQVAGGPTAENILKCQLKPINAADYSPMVLSEAQLNRLKAVFPDGVCDFSKPGVGQQDAISPLDFSAGPGGVPFAAEPLNKAF